MFVTPPVHTLPIVTTVNLMRTVEFPVHPFASI